LLLRLEDGELEMRTLGSVSGGEYIERRRMAATGSYEEITLSFSHPRLPGPIQLEVGPQPSAQTLALRNKLARWGEAGISL
jgi:hypothetical protein